MKKLNLNNIQPRYVRDNKWNGRTKKSIVYTNNYSTKDEELEAQYKKYSPEYIIDAWFNKHDISSIKFASRAWSRAKRVSNKYVYRAIRELIPCKSVVYSRYAGCSCGCSSGYIVTEPELEEHKGVSAWVDYLLLNDEEREELLAKLEELEPLIEEEKAQQACDDAKLVTV